MNREELKARLMADAETAIDAMLARKPETVDITLNDIEALAVGSGKDFREAVLESLVQDS